MDKASENEALETVEAEVEAASDEEAAQEACQRRNRRGYAESGGC